MPLKIDLRTTYSSKLTSRGISGQEAKVYGRVLDELGDFLANRDASDWRPSDLDLFMKGKSPNIGAADRSIYGGALSILLEILDKAALKGAELDFDRAPRAKIPTGSRNPTSKEIKGLPGSMPSLRRAKKLDNSEVSGRAASSGVAFVSSQSSTSSSGSSPTLDSLSGPNLDSASGPNLDSRSRPNFGASEEEQKFKLRPVTRPGRVPSLPYADTAAPHGSHESSTYVLSDPDEVFEGPRRKRRGFQNRPLEEALPDIPDFEDSLPPETAQFGLESHRVEDLVQPNSEGPNKGTNTYFIDENEDYGQPEKPQVAAPDAEAGPQERTLGAVQVGAWRSSSKITKINGGLLVGDRYEVPESFDLVGLSYREVKTSSASEQFFQQHRLAPIVLLVGIFGSVFLFFVQPIAAILLTLLTGAGLAAFAGAFVTLLKLSKQPLTATSSTEALVGYIAALRVGMFERAKAFLAHPGDCEPLTIQELRDEQRGGLGRRFNAASPKALAIFWSKAIANLDRSEGGPLGQRLARRFKPAELDCDLLMSSEDGLIDVLVLRGRALDDYAIIPVVKIGESWLVADGECVLSSSRVEAVSRISRRHAEKSIDDNALVRSISRFNLTRTDISRALLAGALTEEQAQLLVQKTTPPV
ncbi:MAG: hypothetical protein CO108_08850 [Deltaproteobacteria bacterium CG_4_9_14_3_um_filter_63_12]|nr:MAG: hypothetical protein CO108_08850 [Deltaproteobacteria bacterium CG_4_9_14_3_um_filter_63_12]